MNKPTKLAMLFGIAALVGGAYWYSGSRAPAGTTANGPAPVPVTVAAAQTGEMPVLLNIVGRAEAYESVTLKSRIDGQVLSVAYTEGQTVRQGDVLIRLDPGDFNARVAQAEAVVARDQAQLAKARADVERYVGLKSRGFVSDEKVNEIRTNELAQAATLKADQAALDLARLQLSYATIRAPFSGIIGARLVFPGSAVKINDTVLAVVNRVSPLYVTFALPERHLGLVRQAMQSGPMPVRISVGGARDRIIEGQARFIDNAVDATTGTIQMKAVLENRDGALTPGQFLNVSMTLDRLSGVVLVPNEAVQQGSDGNFLYVVKADNTAELRKIDVLTANEGRSAIGKGVAAGETVVTDGQLRLAPGAPVTAKENGAGAPAGAVAPTAPAAAR